MADDALDDALMPRTKNAVARAAALLAALVLGDWSTGLVDAVAGDLVSGRRWSACETALRQCLHSAASLTDFVR
jgi:hypothetical protein